MIWNIILILLIIISSAIVVWLICKYGINKSILGGGEYRIKGKDGTEAEFFTPSKELIHDVIDHYNVKYNKFLLQKIKMEDNYQVMAIRDIKDKSFIGLSLFSIDNGRCMTIHLVYVKKKYRGKRFGANLYFALLNYCNIITITFELLSIHPSIGFWKQLGLNKIEKGETIKFKLAFNNILSTRNID